MTPDIPQKKIQYTRFEYIVNLLKTEVNGGYIVEPITCHNNCIKAAISERQILCIIMKLPTTHMNKETCDLLRQSSPPRLQEGNTLFCRK